MEEKIKLIGKTIEDINFNENNIKIKMEDGTVVRFEFDYDEWIGIRLELYVNDKQIDK